MTPDKQVNMNGGGHLGSNVNPLIKVNSEEANMNDPNGGMASSTSPHSDPSGVTDTELVFLPRAVSKDLLQSELAVMSG